jgi:hypothetical protein
MKITTLALIATATVAATIALPATANADSSLPDYQFQSPSGNIVCLMGANIGAAIAGCEVRDHNWVIPSPTDYGSSPTNGHTGGCVDRFELDQGDAPSSTECLTGSVFPPGLHTLDYGQTRSVGVITCDSEPSGMTCTDSSTGHFFRISNDSYQLG